MARRRRRQGKSLNKLISLARRCSPQGRAHLVRHAPDWFIRALIRSAALYSKGRLSTRKQNQLAPYAHDLHALAQCKNMGKARQRILQHGGFLPALIPILAGLGKAIAGAAAGAAATGIIRKIAG